MDEKTAAMVEHRPGEPDDDDALPPDLQAAVDAAKHPVVPVHWVDADLVDGLTARASGFDPDYIPPAPKRVTDAEFEAAMRQWQKAAKALFVARLGRGQ